MFTGDHSVFRVFFLVSLMQVSIKNETVERVILGTIPILILYLILGNRYSKLETIIHTYAHFCEG